MSASISVVTPTLNRSREVEDLLQNLAIQSSRPMELILVDGAESCALTEKLVARRAPELNYECRYVRCGGGTAIQRNRGIDLARGKLVAFVDDDIRLTPDFFTEMLAVFDDPENADVGGVTGYIDGAFLDPERSLRWRWYRRLRLFGSYEPGRYDFATGYPINRYLQPPHSELRRVDFMGAGCAVWRREVFARGLRFSEFFRGYGVLEDAHLALRASQHWRLLENGRARCIHLRSNAGRADKREIARKSAVNYRYVFVDLVPERSLRQEFGFWRVQIFDLLSFVAYVARSPSRQALMAVVGKLEGIREAATLARRLKGAESGRRQ